MAASQGIARFFENSNCFRSTDVVRIDLSPSAFAVPNNSDLLIVLTVRELDPMVVVDVAQYQPGKRDPVRQFSIPWQHGGSSVIKDVQTLPADMVAALRPGLQVN